MGVCCFLSCILDIQSWKTLDWRTQCLYSTINRLTLSFSTLCICKIRPNIKQTLPYHTHTTALKLTCLNLTLAQNDLGISSYNHLAQHCRLSPFSQFSLLVPAPSLRVVNSVRFARLLTAKRWARVTSSLEHGPCQSETDSRRVRTQGRKYQHRKKYTIKKI